MSLLNVSALVAGQLVAVIGVDNHHAIAFRHFAREFARHHFAVSLLFCHHLFSDFLEVTGQRILPSRERLESVFYEFALVKSAIEGASCFA